MIAFLRRLMILRNSMYGYLKKFKIDIWGISNKSLESKKRIPVIVSLTSYGRRVESVVYYTLISLLNQSVLPEKIILWLDKSWNDENIPKKLLDLKQYGVECRYCDDTRSYKKLLPTLLIYPNAVIVTVDDDVMYVPSFLEALFNSYIKKPNKIHCTRALRPLFVGDNMFDTYINWPDIKFNECSDYIFPIGEGGILYPPHSLSNDVFNIDLAMKLCPQADDIWFWVMALRQNTLHEIVDLPTPFYSFDALYQYFHKGSALTHSNAKENKNDVQLKKIVRYFNLKFK